MNDHAHIPDHELILSLDGELPSAQDLQVRKHLEACWQCRNRLDELVAAFNNAQREYREEFNEQLPDAHSASLQFRERLRKEQARVTTGIAQRGWNPGRWIAPATASIGVVFALVILLRPDGRANPLPDSRLTPGSARNVSREQVCSAPLDEQEQPPLALAVRTFHEYGIRNPKARAYEVDYLITPALGGANDVTNLWPQPFDAGTWNAHVKDALEDYLRALVCRGDVELATAQTEIATNWIAAYRKYFRTSMPLPEHAAFTKDKAWE